MMKNILSAAILAIFATFSSHAAVYDIRDFGAKGDGVTIDTPAINAAIDKAAKDGGGTVFIPAGRWASYSIHLKSHINLVLEKGAVLLAAAPSGNRGYDAPEPGPQPQYQDYGHSHWKNSLIWGIGLEDITISGDGMIDGSNLSEGFGDHAVATGVGNKAISLKECRNIVIRDITIYRGGHFCLLATGVENMRISGVTADTYRDGFDVDCCRNVRISDCLVNSPNDDAIVLKASYGLGRFMDTENVSITNCNVSGYEIGSVLNGTYKKIGMIDNPHSGKPMTNRAGGRIKLGTESSGGFKNISVSNCTLQYSGGLFFESVDGGLLEDVVVSNITMRDCTDCPIFFRLGERMRSPEGTPVGAIRRVLISDVNSYNATPVYGMQITGTPGHCVEDVTIRNVYLNYEGGATMDRVLKEVPENIKAYPDPWMFGARIASTNGPAVMMPAKGMFLRHIRGLVLDGLHFSFNAPDERPLIISEDVTYSTFRDVTPEK